MSDQPRLNSWEHAHRYPKRVVVVWAPLHGGHEWLVMRGVQGEFYPCKPDIFEATYEVAS